jgi:hypothetical protein
LSLVTAVGWVEVSENLKGLVKLKLSNLGWKVNQWLKLRAQVGANREGERDGTAA